MTSPWLGPGGGLSRYSPPVRAGQPERYLGRVGRSACDEYHLVADHLDHLTVVAYHDRGGVLLEHGGCLSSLAGTVCA